MPSIKTISTYSGDVGKSGKVEQEYKRSFQEFDANSNLLQEVFYYPGEAIESRSLFRYDESNQLIEETHFLGINMKDEHIIYRYNEEGYPIEIITTYADATQSIQNTTFKEQIITTFTLDETGHKEMETTTIVNEHGDILEEVSINEDQVVEIKKVFEYDALKRVVALTEYGFEAAFYSKTTFEFNEQGLVSKQSTFEQENGEATEVITNLYNDARQLVSRELEKEGRILFVYNEQQHLVKEENRNLQNKLLSSTHYEYKKEGHLLARKVSFIAEDQETSQLQSIHKNARYEYAFY